MKRSYHLILLLLLFSAIGNAQDTTIIVKDDGFDTLPMPKVPESEDRAVYDEEMTDEEEQEDKKEAAFTPLSAAAKDTIHLRHVDAAALKTLHDDDAFWYANYSFKKTKEAKQVDPGQGRRPLIAHPAFETIMWIVVVVGFITFLVIFLTNNNVALFRRSKTISQQNTVTEFDDIFTINYQQEIGKAIAAGNHNFGVRLLFLRLLSKLAERNIIEYKQDRTNLDYMMQLYRTNYYKDFYRLTRHYEYAWYGQFPLDREKFDLVRSEFENFERNLN